MSPNEYLKHLCREVVDVPLRLSELTYRGSGLPIGGAANIAGDLSPPMKGSHDEDSDDGR